VDISFFLPRTAAVTIKIYGLSGQEKSTLVNNTLGSGPHCLSWDTRNVAAGFYAVRMQAGAATYTKGIPVYQ